MSLEQQFEDDAPSATAEGGEPELSKKALGKRPMTTEQIMYEYSKMPRERSGYDSDDDGPVRCGTPAHVRHARAAAVANLENTPPVPPLSATAVTNIVAFRGADLRSPATVEREWVEDLERAFAREAENKMLREADEAMLAHEEELAREADLFGDDGVVCIEIPDAPTNVLLVQFEPHS
jgi:hypothetical protein